MRAAGTFEITHWDQTEWDDSPSGKLAQARVEKRFSGEVEGVSLAAVLMAETSVGPAAYTAQERFTGSLGGRSGSFIAQHGATEAGSQSGWVIVAGSGSGDLTGLSGTAVLDVGDGSHRITFEYELSGGAG